MAQTDELFKVENLSLSWDGTLPVVEDMNFSIKLGEFVSIVGRSGTGKTTLLHALAGLTTPLSGDIFLRGSSLVGHPGQVSYMLQKDLLLPSKTIIDNACLPLIIKGESLKSARKQAKPLLERFGLGGLEAAWPHQLSGGMRQRAAFLRTYLMGAELMLLDEPFSALDAMTRLEMRSWFASMVEDLGLTVIMVTHDVDEALLMADRILVLAGNPAQKKPAHIVGEIQLAQFKQQRFSPAFEFSPEFLAAKRKLFDLLDTVL